MKSNQHDEDVETLRWSFAPRAEAGRENLKGKARNRQRPNFLGTSTWIRSVMFERYAGMMCWEYRVMGTFAGGTFVLNASWL